MANLHLLAMVFVAAAPFFMLLSKVAAADCNAENHSDAIIQNCSPGTAASDDCCGAVLATLAAGGARCFCLASHLRSSVNAGFTESDYRTFYSTCGGTGDYDIEFSACSSDPGLPTPSSPSSPASTPPPPPLTPPPLLQVEVVEEVPWWHWVLEWFLSLLSFVVLVVLLFFMVKFCGTGRAGNIAAAALERILCVAPNVATPASAERPAENVNGSHSIGMSQYTFECERSTGSNMNHGDEISLVTNHFEVKMANADVTLFHYAVSIKSMDDKVVLGKNICRRVLNKMQQSFGCQLGFQHLVYDGGKSLFTVKALPGETFEFTVSLDKKFSSAGSSEWTSYDMGIEEVEQDQLTESFKVVISYSAKISLAPAALALQGSESEYALRILDAVLRQQHFKRGFMLMNQSHFDSDAHNLVDLTGGVSVCFGVHSSFCTNLGGLTLNMDVSTTILVSPGPLLTFVLSCQNVIDVNDIDWPKADEMLKNLRVVAKHNGMEFRIIGLSELPCSKQTFQIRISSGRTTDITVQDYFSSRKGIKLTMPSLPCLDVGKADNPCYLPIELCHVVSLQRYTKALSSQQRALFLEKSRQKPKDKIRAVKDARQLESYEDDPILSSCGIKIEKHLTRLSGRVLSAPTLVVGNSEVCIPTGGRWNYDSKMFLEPVKIEHWAIVNFSAHCDMGWLSKELINFAHSKGISIDLPQTLLNEDGKSALCSPVQRVELMFERVSEKLKNPEFLLCVLPERKNCDIYGPWKRKCLLEMGIATQCIAPCAKANGQYFDNVLLKINVKLGGANHRVAWKHHEMIPAVTQLPTLILGMDVSHRSTGEADLPSVAVVVGSRCWPQVTRYKASVRTQPPKTEIINSLFTPLHGGMDSGMIRELLLEFYESSHRRKPSQIIIFRDGVSDSQFTQVLNVELNQIIKAYANMGWGPRPKFTIIVAQKNHHTKLFQSNSTENVPAGTVVDTIVVKPRYRNFYMCAHTGITGTSRPVHYHVLLDEIGFATNDLQELVHSLSYINQRSTSANSIVAPIRYAHLAAAQMGKLLKCQEFAATESQSGSGARESTAFPELPRLHQNISSSMFFC